jgi:hypothetical protein
MLDIISNVVSSVVIAALIIYVIILRREKHNARTVLTNITIDYMLLKDELQKTISAKEDQSIEQTDGFLKFISDSREWAFNYIEEVQSGLEKFTDTVGPTLKYLNTYGQAVTTPHDEAIKKITEAYKELEKLLPKDIK